MIEPVRPAQSSRSMPRITRRQALRSAGALGLGALVMPLLQGCAAGLFASPVKATLAIAPGSQTMWRYLAVKSDELFAGKNYQLQFQAHVDETALREAFTSGQADIIASLVPTVALLALQGLDVQFFLPIAWVREGYPLVARKSAGVTHLTDLRGKRVALYPSDHPGTAYWRAILHSSYKMRTEDLDVQYTLAPDSLLTAGQVEVAMLGSVQWTRIQSDSNYVKLTDLQTEWRKISGSDRMLMFGGYIAHRSFLNSNEQFVRDFAQAHIDAFQLYRSNKKVLLEEISGELAGPPVSYEENESIAHYLGYEDVDPMRVLIGDQDIAEYNRLFGMMVEAGFLMSSPPDAARLFRKVQI